MLMGDPAAADVLQETNLDLWSRIDDYDFDALFYPGRLVLLGKKCSLFAAPIAVRELFLAKKC